MAVFIVLIMFRPMVGSLRELPANGLELMNIANEKTSGPVDQKSGFRIILL